MLVDSHKCASTSRIKSSMASQGWVADRALPLIRANPTMGASELEKALEQKYNVTIGYGKVWAGRQLALEQLYGPWEESFQSLYSFKAELERIMPGSIVEIDTKVYGGKTHFHKMFVALKPCIDGFLNGCRPYLGIDSTFLTGRYNGQLASATAIDGHNWMYPVAYGIIDSESAENWTWFMQQLRKAIGKPHGLTLHTDAGNGVCAGVKRVFPDVEHRECFRHLWGNMQKKFHGPVVSNNMWTAARSYKYEDLQEHIQVIQENCPAAIEYLNQYHPHIWSRALFNTIAKCDYMHNNIAETYNSWIMNVKDLPVVELMDTIRNLIMQRYDKRRRIGDRLQGRILPAVIHELNASTRSLGHLKATPGANTSAEVVNMLDNRRHVVHLLSRECTCREWQVSGKPCQHALRFICSNRQANMEDYVDDFFSLAKFKAAYAGIVQPMTDKSQWRKIDPGFKLHPPQLKRSAGRPKTQRFKAANEVPKKKRQQSKQKCKTCGELGHQSRGACPLKAPKKR